LNFTLDDSGIPDRTVEEYERGQTSDRKREGAVRVRDVDDCEAEEG
jgi:hypothetical protein